MNSVDLMDQQRSTNPTRRNEKRLSMTMFTLLLDLAVHNAFSLHCWLVEHDEEGVIQEIKYREFKRRIATLLVGPYLTYKREKLLRSKYHYNTDVEHILGESSSDHMILPTKNNQRIQCHLCKLVDNSKQRKSSYCCSICGVGFHPECFTAFHYQDVLSLHRKALYQVVRAGNSRDWGRRNKNKSTYQI